LDLLELVEVLEVQIGGFLWRRRRDWGGFVELL
jgi:hypothetical protein